MAPFSNTDGTLITLGAVGLLAVACIAKKGSLTAETNYEGLTWLEWVRAARAWGVPAMPDGTPVPEQQLEAAWEDGEDTTEYAANTVEF